jgi:nitrogen fixation protein NifX
MRVAFATTDLETVDAHFGTTPRLAFYELDALGGVLVDQLVFPAAGEDGDHDKLRPRLEALAGCTLLFSTAIGPTAAALLAARRVRPAQAPSGQRIDLLVERLVRLLAGSPPPWLQKALRQGEPRDPSAGSETAQAGSEP